MWIVNENVATRKMAGTLPTEGEGEGPRFEVEFGDDGRARCSQDVGEFLIEKFDPIREATGPEDKAAAATDQADEDAPEDEGGS